MFLHHLSFALKVKDQDRPQPKDKAIRHWHCSAIIPVECSQRLPGQKSVVRWPIGTKQNYKYENKLKVTKQNCKLHNKITSLKTKLQVIKQNCKLHNKVTSLKTKLQVIKQKYKFYHRSSVLEDWASCGAEQE